MEIIRKHFDVIDSTNTWAKQNASLFDRDKMILITARSQTAGRGRFNRRWESPAGQNIYATFAFFVQEYGQAIGNIPQVLALSAVKILAKFGFSTQIKWPNDILLSKKKVGGILAETSSFLDRYCLAIGIGLNINMPLELLQAIDRPATSLIVESGKAYSIEEVLQSLQNEFRKDLKIFFSEGFHAFLNEYRSYISHEIGERIRFHDNLTIWEGAFQRINEDGSLSIKLEDGERKTFFVGEILWD